MQNEFAKCEIKTSAFSGRKPRAGNYWRFLKFRRHSMPLWDFRFFTISSYLTTTNTEKSALF